MKSYTSVSINSMLVAINCFFTFINQPGYRVKLLKIQKRTCIEKERELTKKDYARLLKAAQDTHNERMYLLLQTICATGIRVSEHRFITVEAVKSRKAAVQNKGKLRYIFFPSRLRKQLLAYCKRKKITSGSVFVTNSGRPLDRSNIWKAMKSCVSMPMSAAIRFFRIICGICSPSPSTVWKRMWFDWRISSGTPPLRPPGCIR